MTAPAARRRGTPSLADQLGAELDAPGPRCGAVYPQLDVVTCGRLPDHLTNGTLARESHAAYRVWGTDDSPSWVTWTENPA